VANTLTGVAARSRPNFIKFHRVALVEQVCELYDQTNSTICSLLKFH